MKITGLVWSSQCRIGSLRHRHDQPTGLPSIRIPPLYIRKSTGGSLIVKEIYKDLIPENHRAALVKSMANSEVLNDVTARR